MAAIRECLEETGLKCARVEHLVHYFPGMDNLVYPTDIFLARDVADTGSFQQDESEITGRQILLLESSSRLDCIAGGEIVGGMTIMGCAVLFVAARSGALMASASHARPWPPSCSNSADRLNWLNSNYLRCRPGRSWSKSPTRAFAIASLMRRAGARVRIASYHTPWAMRGQGVFSQLGPR